MGVKQVKTSVSIDQCADPSSNSINMVLCKGVHHSIKKDEIGQKKVINETAVHGMHIILFVNTYFAHQQFITVFGFIITLPLPYQQVITNSFPTTRVPCQLCYLYQSMITDTLTAQESLIIAICSKCYHLGSRIGL